MRVLAVGAMLVAAACVGARATHAAGAAADATLERVPASTLPDRRSDLVHDVAAASVELAGPGPRAIERADFAAVARAIGNARIVLLGEPWHGDGGAIALRGRLVEYLHEHAGFDVLAFEADFYSVHEAWEEARRTGDLGIVRDQIYPFWSRTRAADPLWTYIGESMRRGDTLHVAGVDPKIVGPLAQTRLPHALGARLAQLPGGRAAADDAVATLEAAIHPTAENRVQMNDSAFERLDLELARLEHAVAVPSNRLGGLVVGGRRSPDDLYWGEVANSLRRSLSSEQRDFAMGANLVWLASRQYAGKKIIVWAHNNHIVADKWMLFDGPDSMRTVGSRPDTTRARTAYLGDEVRRAFGARAFVLGMTVDDGSYSPDIEAALNYLGPPRPGQRAANFDSVTRLQPTPPGALEAQLRDAGRAVAFVDLRPFIGRGVIPTRTLDYTRLGPIRLDLPRGFDGLLFLRRTFGLNEPEPAQP